MTSREMEKQHLISHTANALCDRGLGSTALIALEAGRPLAFLVGQLLWVLQPTIGLLVPGEGLAQIAAILEDPEAVDHLIAHLSERNEAEVGRT